GSGQNAAGSSGAGLGVDPVVRHHEYRDLLLLASGIQMAGPNLTPGTFEAALQRTVFPNPPSPLFAGHVGFSTGSHRQTIDAAEWWWSVNTVSPYKRPNGTICYVDHGLRHSPDDWP